MNDPDDPLPDPEIPVFEILDIGGRLVHEAGTVGDSMLAPSRPAASVKSERILTPLQLHAPRARRAESISSAVSRDLERGDALPRFVQSSRSSRHSGSDNSNPPSLVHRTESNASSEALERRQPADTNTNAHDDFEHLFVAFRESRWIRSVVIAKVGFLTLTIMVLGNLIYSYPLIVIHTKLPQDRASGEREFELYLGSLD